MAKEYLDRLECPHVLVIPGNHDSRNVGYVHFEHLFGPRSVVLHTGEISIVGVDSTEPDLDYGTIGRSRYGWLEEQFAAPARFRIFMLHHHLLPIPGTGRERNMVYDAGDTLEVLQRCNVNLVLSGHKHVPHAWHFENMFVVNAGTVCTLRLRGDTRPCYNIVTIDDDHVRIERKYPFHGSETIIEFSPSTLHYQKFAGRPERAAARHLEQATRAAWTRQARRRGARRGAAARRRATRRDRADRRRALPAGRGRHPARSGGALRAGRGALCGRRGEAA